MYSNKDLFARYDNWMRHTIRGGVNIATSSIKKNFLVSGEKQAELFADAIESSYMESFCRKTENELRITYLRGAEDIRKFMAKRKEVNA